MWPYYIDSQVCMPLLTRTNQPLLSVLMLVHNLATMRKKCPSLCGLKYRGQLVMCGDSVTKCSLTAHVQASIAAKKARQLVGGLNKALVGRRRRPKIKRRSSRNGSPFLVTRGSSLGRNRDLLWHHLVECPVLKLILIIIAQQVVITTALWGIFMLTATCCQHSSPCKNFFGLHAKSELHIQMSEIKTCRWKKKQWGEGNYFYCQKDKKKVNWLLFWL